MSPARNVYVGQEIERTEDFRFLTGRGTFVDDYEPAGLLHAAILRSAVPHGRIAGIDAAAALRMPGVYAVICAAGAAAFDSVDPPDDIHAPGDYRRALLRVLTERALSSAAQPDRGDNV